LTALALQEHVSIGSDGSFLDEAAPKPHRILLEHAALHLSIMYHRVAPSAKAATSQKIVKPAKFSQICSFRVTLDPPNDNPDFLGAHVRIRGDPALLCIGAELEICSEHATDCFGKVVAVVPCRSHSAAAAAGAEAAVFSLHVEVSRRMEYLPCTPQQIDGSGTLREVVRIFVAQSDELKAEVAAREAAASAQHRLQLSDGLESINDLKQRAVQDMDAAVQLTQDELGAVLLRDGFLASQPLVSACVRALIVKWYPHTHEDECVRAFRSRDGPWDMFYVFDYLRKRSQPSDRSSSSSFSKLLEELGYVGAADVAYGDRQQRMLEELMDRCFRRLRRGVWRHSNLFLLIDANALQDFCRAQLVGARWRGHRRVCRCAAGHCRISAQSVKTLDRL
jgi:hypothetical protein